MNLESLESVTAHRNHREKALALREAATSGPIRCHLAYKGEQRDVFSTISAEPVRQAIIDACTDFIVETEEKLSKLGVSVKDPEPKPDRSAEYWCHQTGMYARAWQRSLGNRLAPKRHLIDALVLTTERLFKSAGAK